MKEKIIMITTASVEEDLADGKTLDFHQVKGMYEKYGEEAISEFIINNSVVFKALDYEEICIYGSLEKSSTIEEALSGYPIISYTNDNKIHLMSSYGGPKEDYVICKKVQVGRA